MKRPWISLLGLGLLSALARWLYWFVVDPTPAMQGLTSKYLLVARFLAEGRGFTLWVSSSGEVIPYVERLPGYPVLLFFFRALVGEETVALRPLHCLIGGATSVLLVLLGRRLGGEWVGWATGLLHALWPPWWRSDGELLETGCCGLALVLVTLATFRFVEERTWRRGIELALLGVLAAVLRPDNMIVAPATWLALLGLRVPSKEIARTMLPFVVVFLTLALSWGARNARVADGFFVTCGLGNNLLQGFGESVSGPDAPYGDRNISAQEGHSATYWPNPGQRDAERRRRALELIRAQPVTWGLGCLKRIPVLLSLHPGPLWPGGVGLREQLERVRNENPGLPRQSGAIRAAFRALSERPFHLLFTLGWTPLFWGLVGWGAWVGLRSGEASLRVAAWCVGSVPFVGLVSHLPLHAEPRYFLPFAVPLMAWMGLGLAALFRRRQHEAVEIAS
ncbi:MAG: glycosyltransferase family 39 protein [Acidobacteriota bacterium]